VIRGAMRNPSILKILVMESLQFESFSLLVSSGVVYRGWIHGPNHNGLMRNLISGFGVLVL
ncbi:hypothetical protein, partial [Tateyamaria sp.]|uniref:hypothetical protein n=1 Tax=Tateyamaria sp. TaxID=1929288 RepID=UPI003B216AF6